MSRETPCFACPKPELDQSNYECWEVFRLLTRQIRAGAMGGVLGIDFALAPFIFELKRVPVEDWEFMLDKLVILNTVLVKYANIKTDSQVN